MHNYRNPREAQIDDNELSSEILIYLQGVGSYTHAQDIVEFSKNEDIQKQHEFSKPISLSTVKCWMGQLGYCWTKELKGQYQDGHKCADVVEYCQKTFLPAWTQLEDYMHVWTNDDIHLKVNKVPKSMPDIKNMVVWFHDKLTFYAHDCRAQHWIHKNEGPKPQPKGEGISLMVAHFVSADYSYLQLPNGTESTCILFKAGKGHNGYYTNELIIQHAKKAIEIVQKYYPDDDHILVFDNVITHVKQAGNALSAQRMPKNPLFAWGVTVPVKDKYSAIAYHPDGKPQITKVPMEPRHFANGEPQPLYFPDGHEKAGWFKGMAQILCEQGFEAKLKLHAQCDGFCCLPGKISCCCC